MNTIKISAESLESFQHDKNVVDIQLPEPPEFIRMDDNGNVVSVWYGTPKQSNELDHEELLELKERYLSELEEEGIEEEVLGFETSWWIDADKAISDEFIIEKYSGINFFHEDFWCNRPELDN